MITLRTNFVRRAWCKDYAPQDGKQRSPPEALHQNRWQSTGFSPDDR